MFSVLGCKIGWQLFLPFFGIELKVGTDGWAAHGTDMASSSRRGVFLHSILFLSVAFTH